MSAKKNADTAGEAVKGVVRGSRAKRNDEASGQFFRMEQESTVIKVHQDSQMVSILLAGSVSDDRMAIYRAVKNGFPLQSVLDMIDNSEVFKQRGVLSRIMGTSDRMLARRLKTPDEALTAEQSTRALNYAEVLEKATQLLGSRELAEQWMVKPARGLEGETPIDLISNSVGHELVTDLLTRIEYGIY
ncbi:type II RES/Xre toxin-antitoxin system antitoxin [Pseudomonas sp. NPDC086278]|uniref:type II RES/Xre toxin-antitoxin system antitoxin n=1 Tax=Pseudomonas sp. NPDC086278 TaxID=3390646 RepID=UPI003D07DC95